MAGNSTLTQPLSRGGADEIDNLVYCCTRCNRYKGDFWPTTEGLAAGRRILHPQRDNLTFHLKEETDGRLSGLTDAGKFHIHRLRLNRPELVALRAKRQKMAQLRQSVEELAQQQQRLYEQIRRLRTEHRAALENEAILLDIILDTLRRVLSNITEE